MCTQPDVVETITVIISPSLRHTRPYIKRRHTRGLTYIHITLLYIGGAYECMLQCVYIINNTMRYSTPCVDPTYIYIYMYSERRSIKYR